MRKTLWLNIFYNSNSIVQNHQHLVLFHYCHFQAFPQQYLFYQFNWICTWIQDKLPLPNSWSTGWSFSSFTLSQQSNFCSRAAVISGFYNLFIQDRLYTVAASGFWEVLLLLANFPAGLREAQESQVTCPGSWSVSGLEQIVTHDPPSLQSCSDPYGLCSVVLQ